MMIRKAKKEDAYKAAELALLLWPNHTIEDLSQEMEVYICGENSSVFLAFEQDSYVGFAQCSLRFDYVEGTNTSPVGYLEGIYVKKEYRNKRLGRTLLNNCERWAAEKGCKEFASDCEIDNINSLNFHIKYGFIEQNRTICFAKQIEK